MKGEVLVRETDTHYQVLIATCCRTKLSDSKVFEYNSKKLKQNVTFQCDVCL